MPWTIRGLEVQCSEIDWPCNHEATEPIPAVVTTATRKKLYGYGSDDLKILATIDEAVALKKAKHQFAAYVDLYKGSYKVLYWLDNAGKRLGQLGVSAQKFQDIQAFRRVIYVIRSCSTTDDVVYVGQSLNAARRVAQHFAAARSGRGGREWERWMSEAVIDGGGLHADCVDAVRGTKYHAQSLEEIWRKVMLLKGYRPYLNEEKLEMQRSTLMDEVPHFVAHRYIACSLEPFINKNRD